MLTIKITFFPRTHQTYTFLKVIFSKDLRGFFWGTFFQGLTRGGLFLDDIFSRTYQRVWVIFKKYFSRTLQYFFLFFRNIFPRTYLKLTFKKKIFQGPTRHELFKKKYFTKVLSDEDFFPRSQCTWIF